jgi:hypothetical protein
MVKKTKREPQPLPDWRKPLRDYQRPETEKVTGEQLQERMAQAREQRAERRENRTEAQQTKILRRNVLIAGGLAVIAMGAGMGISSQHTATASAENEQRISELRSELSNQKQSASAQGKKSQTSLDPLIAGMTADAEHVTSLQLAYLGLVRKASQNEGDANGGSTPELEAIADHRADLAPYFTDKDLIGGKDAGSYSSIDPFDPGTQIDPRWPWYVRYDGEKASTTKGSTWTLEAATPTTGAAGQGIPEGFGSQGTATWVCRDAKTHTALAWAQADYTLGGEDLASGVHGQFSNLEVTTTQAGTKHLPTTKAVQS